MTLRHAVCVLTLAFCSGQALAQAAAAPKASTAPDGLLTSVEGKRILQQALAQHYSLWALGMIEFRCDVQPDWDAFYAQMQADSIGRRQFLPVLKIVRLQVLMSPDGTATVTHEPDIAATADPKLVESLRSTLVDIENSFLGFTKTWSSFAVAAPLPELDSEYRVAIVNGKYLVTYNEGSGVVHTTIGADFRVEEVIYTAPDLSTTIHPTWARLQSRFLLSGYEGRAQVQSRNPERLIARIDNQVVEGLQFPAIVQLTATSTERSIVARFTISECKVKKKRR